MVVPPQLGSLTSSVTSRRYWVVLRKETAPSEQSRLDLYRSEDQVNLTITSLPPPLTFPPLPSLPPPCQMFQGQPYREIGLDEVRSIQQLDQKKSFVVQLPSTSLLFMCSSRADLKVCPPPPPPPPGSTLLPVWASPVPLCPPPSPPQQDWVSDVRRFRTNRLSSIINGHGHADEVVAAGHEVYEGVCSGRAPPTTANHPPPPLCPPVVPDDETFAVRLRKSSTLRFSGHCLLEILRDFERSLFHVALFTDEQPPRLIVKWQIDHIRQYGSNQMAFKFQSGRWAVGTNLHPSLDSLRLTSIRSARPLRKSPTGVDWFILDTEPGVAARVHRAVDYWAQHIVEQANNLQGRSSSLVGPPLPPSLSLPPSLPPSLTLLLSPPSPPPSLPHPSPLSPPPPPAQPSPQAYNGPSAVLPPRPPPPRARSTRGWWRAPKTLVLCTTPRTTLGHSPAQPTPPSPTQPEGVGPHTTSLCRAAPWTPASMTTRPPIRCPAPSPPPPGPTGH